MPICMITYILFLSADGIVINMVVGGEVVTLKSIEENTNVIIAEMPIQVNTLPALKLRTALEGDLRNDEIPLILSSGNYILFVCNFGDSVVLSL